MVINNLLDRAALGAILTALVSYGGYKAGMLTRGGAAAGLVAGTISIAAGWSWGFLLVGLFLTASALSKVGERRKTKLVASIAEKAGRRDAWQVAANGLVYVMAAAAFLASGRDSWYALGIGALAAAAADTWSTEIGTLGGRVPRLIVSGKRVPAGTSGGITLAGTIGALAGAVIAAGAALLARWPVSFAAIVAAGLAGAFGDSLLGATAQSKRWCEGCAASTEQTVHICGTPTIHTAGIGWLNNDGVNLVATIIGGVVALFLSGVGSSG